MSQVVLSPPLPCLMWIRRPDGHLSFSLLTCGRLSGTEVGYFLPSRSISDKNPNSLGFSKSFSWVQALFDRTKYSGIFQNGSFPPSPAKYLKGLFPFFYSLWQPGRASESKTHKSGVVNSQTYPQWASNNSSITLPGTGFQRGVCLRFSALLNCASLYGLSLQLKKKKRRF